MELLVAVIRIEVWFFLLGVMGIVVYKAATGSINMRGLLINKETKSVSSARIQLLLFTLTGSIYILSGVVEDSSRFPKLPTEMIVVLGGSHLLFLGSKGGQRLLNLLTKSERTKLKE